MTKRTMYVIYAPNSGGLQLGETVSRHRSIRLMAVTFVIAARRLRLRCGDAKALPRWAFAAEDNGPAGPRRELDATEQRLLDRAIAGLER